MKSNIKLIKLLNDLKKQPSDGARDLKISLNYMQKKFYQVKKKFLMN